MELKTSRLQHALQPTIWVSPNGYIKINLHQVEIRLCKFVNKFINLYIIILNLLIIKIVYFVVKFIDKFEQ